MLSRYLSLLQERPFLFDAADTGGAAPTESASPAAPTESAESPGSDGGSDSQPDQKAVDDVVTKRLAQAERKHKRQLEAARSEAVAEYRRKHGLTDEIMQGARDNPLNLRIANLEQELSGYREAEAARAEEQRQAAIAEVVQAAGSIIPKALPWVVRELGEHLDVVDGVVKVVESDEPLQNFIQGWLHEYSFVVQPPTGQGAGTRTNPSQLPEPPATTPGNPFGATETSKAQRAAAWAKLRQGR